MPGPPAAASDSVVPRATRAGATGENTDLSGIYPCRYQLVPLYKLHVGLRHDRDMAFLQAMSQRGFNQAVDKPSGN
jgi:hypothetical protein